MAKEDKETDKKTKKTDEATVQIEEVEKKKKKKDEEEEDEEDEGGTKKLGRSEREIARMLDKPVPAGFVRHSIQQTMKNRTLMRGLFFYVIFIILFVFFFMSRREVEAEYFMTQSLRDHLLGEELPPTSPLTPDQWNTGPYYEKNWDGIDHIEDFYDFVEMVLIPQLFESAPDNTLDRRLTGQNIPIGPLRIRAKHVTNRSCSINKYLYPDENNVTVPRVCYGRYDRGVELKETIGKGNYTWNFTQGCDGWLLNNVAGRYDRYDCSSYNVDIPFNTTLEDALQIAATLRKGDFGNILSLRFLSIEMFTYNPAVDAFTSVRMFVEVAMSGAMMPQGRFRPFRVHNEDSKGWSFYYVFFTFVVTLYLIKYIRNWRRSIAATGSKIVFFFDVWNFLEGINLLAFYVTFGFLFYWWNLSLNIKWTLPYEQVDVFPLDLQSLSEAMFYSVYFNALNTVIVFMKILRYLRLNSRLNILQRTIDAAAQSIIGVLIVFCLVVLAYCLAGHNLYGTGLWEYRTVDESFAQMFRALIGEFDYYAMRDFNRGVTFVYFWTFTILGLFVCLNFVIAVLMNSFDDESAKTHSLPLHVGVKQTLRSIKQFLLTPGIAGRVISATFSTVDKMPEVILDEHLGEYFRQRKLALEALDEGQIEDQDDDEENTGICVEDELLRRYDWEKFIPRTTLEEIGEDYLNHVWCDVVADYELINEPEDVRKVKDVCDTVFAAVSDASAKVFVKHKKRLFGEPPPAETGKKFRQMNEGAGTGLLERKASRRDSMGRRDSSAGRGDSPAARRDSSSVRRDSLLNRIESKRTLSRRESMRSDRSLRISEESQMKRLQRERQLPLHGGKFATSNTEIVEELDERLTCVERRFAAITELLDGIAEKVTFLK